MSYVPATFTAGLALILTAAGAASSEWVSDLQRSYVQAAPARARAQQDAAAAAIGGFKARTAAYATFHREVEKSLAGLEAARRPTPDAAHEQALGDALIKARPGARVGEYFGDFATPLRRIVREDFTRRSAADRQALVQEGPGVTVDINTIYPAAMPPATLPPALLRVLPDLPEVLEYRIVGRDLILLDTKAHVVVDALRNVLPA